MTMQDDARQMIGFHVIASDDEDLGTIERVYLDNRTQQPEFVSVKGGGLFGRRESLVPLQGSRVSGEQLRVPFDKQMVKDAPDVGSANDISPEEGERLYHHYGLRSADVPAQQKGEADRMSDRGTDRGTDRTGDRTDMAAGTGTAAGMGAGQDMAAKPDTRMDARPETGMDARPEAGTDAKPDAEAEHDAGMDTQMSGAPPAAPTAATPTAAAPAPAAMDEPGPAAMEDRAATEPHAATGDRTTAPDAAAPADRRVASARAWDDSDGDQAGEIVVTRYEEKMHVGTERHEAGRARIHKRIEMEDVERVVPVSREEIQVIREPISENERMAPGAGGTDSGDDEHVIVLYAERPVVSTERVPVERVRISKSRTQDQETVRGQIRKERIDVDDDLGPQGQ